MKLQILSILACLAIGACNPSTKSEQSSDAASDTGSVFDTTANTALDSANVQRVEGQGQMESPSDASHSDRDKSENHNSGGSRVNVGRDTAGEFKQEAEKRQ